MMRKLSLVIFLFCQISLAVTNNKVWRVPNGSTIPSWGAVNLADGTNAITGALASKSNLPAVGQQVSGSSGNFSTASTSYNTPTNLSVTITTTGRPVLLIVQGSGVTGLNNSGYTCNSSSSACNMNYRFIRDAANLGNNTLGSQATGATAISMAFPSSISQLDTGATAGSHTYQFQVAAGLSGSPTVFAVNLELIAFEL